MAETFGRYLVNSELPPEYRITGAATKKDFAVRMSELAKKDPKRYASLIANFKRLGDTLSTQEGMSVGLDDITPMYTQRNQLLRPYQDRFKTAKSDEARRRIAD